MVIIIADTDPTLRQYDIRDDLGNTFDSQDHSDITLTMQAMLAEAISKFEIATNNGTHLPAEQVQIQLDVVDRVNFVSNILGITLIAVNNTGNAIGTPPAS